MSYRFTFTPTPPYSLDLTAIRFTRFKDEIVDRVQPQHYQRLLFVDGQVALATVSDVGTVAKPQLQVELQGPRDTALDRPEFAAQLRHILSIDLDLKPFYRAARADELLGPITPRFRGLKLPASPTVFESLVMAVLSQQVNLTFAYSIKRELVETFGIRWQANGETHYAFPLPERFAEATPERLLRFRLSNAKAATLVRLGAAFASGALQEEELAALPDEEVVDRLTQLKGIGRWSAEIALLRGLARPDAFPAGDLGVVKYVAQGLLGKAEKATEADMREFAERWRPYRGLALIYCYAELMRRRAE
ncbi:MAG TPA: DNA-3-methyladenine glycosylase [Methylomirabilota bacterium]|jgi:DNA-3-methyladenine glycosylase II|nr:DNA-3-methyladenine glycosylase [Methylomirabilota bacterium]